ncbi:MAG: hypothetical protein ACI8RZ_003423 [Myxococcota bacterium]
MLIGLMHTHRTLAYLLFLVALVNLVLALSRGRNDPGFARGLHLSHKIGIMMLGRLSLVLGAALWYLKGWPITTWWLWVSFLLWGPIEVLSKRLVAPEVSLVQDGGQASGRLIGGVVGELLIIAVIFGLMSARPG